MERGRMGGGGWLLEEQSRRKLEGEGQRGDRLGWGEGL